MKIQTTLSTFFLVFLCVQTCFTQEFRVPDDVKLEAAEDYKKYETDILNCINWLENNPVNENMDKRQKANAFLMQWVTGTPTVTIEMQSFQLDLVQKNAGLLMSFLGGWIKHSIENPSDKNNVLAGNIAGFKSLIKVYAANKKSGMKKDKQIEKLMKMDEPELRKWVSKKLE